MTKAKSLMRNPQNFWGRRGKTIWNMSISRKLVRLCDLWWLAGIRWFSWANPQTRKWTHLKGKESLVGNVCIFPHCSMIFKEKSMACCHSHSWTKRICSTLPQTPCFLQDEMQTSFYNLCEPSTVWFQPISWIPCPCPRLSIHTLHSAQCLKETVTLHPVAHIHL